MNQDIKKHLSQIKLPTPDSHKGQNGKLLIIGGSELFHAASKWSLDIASRFVDMLFYSSLPDNNELIKKVKGEFWNGIVLPRGQVEEYVEESDCILIGPGMERTRDTEKIVNNLLKKYPDKKWVVDAGALQMVNPSLLTSTCIVTPHRKEFVNLLEKCKMQNEKCQINDKAQILKKGVIILLKGQSDLIMSNQDEIEVTGGNPGMTKGGTGDVLAGLVAALYCQHDAITSAVVGSYINKKTGDELYKKVGPYFNASDLVSELPKVFWQETQDPAMNAG